MTGKYKEYKFGKDWKAWNQGDTCWRIVENGCTRATLDMVTTTRRIDNPANGKAYKLLRDHVGTLSIPTSYGSEFDVHIPWTWCGPVKEMVKHVVTGLRDCAGIMLQAYAHLEDKARGLGVSELGITGCIMGHSKDVQAGSTAFWKRSCYNLIVLIHHRQSLIERNVA